MKYFVLIVLFVLCFSVASGLQCILGALGRPLTNSTCTNSNYCFKLDVSAANINLDVQGCDQDLHIEGYGIKTCKDFGKGLQKIDSGGGTGSLYCCDTDLCNDKIPDDPGNLAPTYSFIEISMFTILAKFTLA